MKTFKLIILNLLSIYVIGQNQAQTILTDETKVKLDSLISSTYSDTKPGGTVAILSDGEKLYNNSKGLSNVEYNLSISDSTKYDIGSLSKQFTAFTVLLLEEEGKLKLDDAITNYLPELSHLPSKITIRQLLNHTHGLPNSLELAELCGQDRMNHKEIVSMLLKINTINFYPGEKFEYNNTGYTLMAEIISRVEDRPFQEVLSDRIFMQLGMKNTAVINNPNQVVKNKASSYSYEGNQFDYLFNDKSSMGPGGICTDINDLSLWANNFLKPRVGNRNMYMEMQRLTHLNDGEPIQYGLGVQSKKYKGVNLVFHGGADASYRSYLVHIPESDISIISLSNDGSFSALELAYSMVDLVLGLDFDDNFISKTKIELSQEDINLYEGTYEMFPGKYFNIVSRNDSLFFQQYGYKFEIPLKLKKRGTYEIPMLPHYKIVFGEDKFDFHIVDSKFTCNKVMINPPKLDHQSLLKFVGVYQNEAFGIIYSIEIKDDKLIAHSGYNSDITLMPLADLSFYSSLQHFGKIDFQVSEDGGYDSFKLSGSFLKNLIFVRI